MATTLFQSHEVDHIYAEKHGGLTAEANLSLSCALSNRHKGTDLASLDPETGEVVPLFHPRLDAWTEHFILDGAVIKPRSPRGRAAVRLLAMNHCPRILERMMLIQFGRYPHW